MSSQSRYALLFKGLKDDGSETLRKVKTVFVADLELPIPQIQEILSNPPATILEEESKQKLSITLRKLKAAGALVEIIQPEEETDGDDDEDEFAFELDLSELAGASKPAKTRVWELNMQDSDETEDLIANLEIPSMVSPGSEPLDGEIDNEEDEELLEAQEEAADTPDQAPPSIEDFTPEQARSVSVESEDKEDLTIEEPPSSDSSIAEELDSSAPEEEEDLTLGEPNLPEEDDEMVGSDWAQQAQELSISNSEQRVDAPIEPELSDDENLDLMLDSLDEEEHEQESAEIVSPQGSLLLNDVEEDNLDLMLEALDEAIEEETEPDNFSSSIQELTGEHLDGTQELDVQTSAQETTKQPDSYEESEEQSPDTLPESAPSEDLDLSFDEDTEDLPKATPPETPRNTEHEDLGLLLDVDAESESEADPKLPPTPEQKHESPDLGLSLDEDTMVAEALAAVDNARKKDEDDSPLNPNSQFVETTDTEEITIDLSANTELEPEVETQDASELEAAAPMTSPKAKSRRRKEAASTAKEVDTLEDNNVLSLDSSEAHQPVRVEETSSARNNRLSQKKALAIKEIAIPIVLALCALVVLNYSIIPMVLNNEEVNPLGKFDDSKVVKPQYEIPAKTEPEELPEFQTINEQVSKQLILKSDEGLSISARCDLSDKGLVACEIQGTGPESRELTKLELAKKVKRPPWIKKFDTPRLLFKLVTADQSRIAEGPIRVVINYDNRIYRAAGNIRLSTNKIAEHYQESPEEILKEAKELRELNIDPEDIQASRNELKFEIFLGSEPRSEEGFAVTVEEPLKFIFTAKYHFEY